MLSLEPKLSVSTATALAAWYGHRESQDVGDDRSTPNTKHTAASLRFVHFAGFWSHFAPDSQCSSWPLPLFDDIDGLAGFAEHHGTLEATPAMGDVFLLGSFGADRHVLAGIVASVESSGTLLNGSPEFVCTTIEGEAAGEDGDNAENPHLVFVTARLVRRRLSGGLGDLFIRWCRLSPLELAGSVEYEAPKDVVRFGQPDPSSIMARLDRALGTSTP